MTELQTITRLWLFAQHLYSVWGYALLVPVSHRMIWWAAGVFAPWWFGLRVFGVQFEDFAGLFLHFAVPAVIIWLAVRQAGEGARPVDSLVSWCRLAGWLYLAYKADPGPLRLRGRVRTTA